MLLFAGLHVDEGGGSSKQLKHEESVTSMKDGVEEDEAGSSFSFLMLSVSTDDPSKETEIGDRSGGGFSFLDKPIILAPRDLDGQEDHSECLDSQFSLQAKDNHDSLELCVSLAKPVEQSSNQTVIKPSQQTNVGNRLTPATSDKKKKRKAIRPGRNAELPILSSTHDTSTSINSTSTDTNEASVPSVVFEPSLIEDDVSPTSTAHLRLELSPTLEETDDVSLHEEPCDEGDSPVVHASDDGINEVLNTDSGKYIVQFSHEESLAGLLQSYASGLTKLKYV